MSSTTIMDRPAQPARPRPEPASERSEAGTASPAIVRRRSRKPLIFTAILLLALGGGGWAGWRYWTDWRFEVSTDDAYVQADSVTIAPKVSGYLLRVEVGDNERVRAGQVLARIDPRDYQTALDQARAVRDAAAAKVDALRSTIEQQGALIAQAKATLDVDQANLVFARQDSDRYAALAARGNGSLQNAQSATSRIDAARATLQRDQAAVTAATAELGTLKADLQQAQAEVTQDEAAQAQAELNLSYTTIKAPTDGVVGARTLRVGQYVEPGTQLLAVVPLDAAYIVANYKETQLTDVRAGQPVEIAVDMFPGVIVKGRVDSLSPASGQSFALLPPDNATGNFTKIVQRIPVRISLDPDNPLAGLLRPGMSVIPTIDVHDVTPLRSSAQG